MRRYSWMGPAGLFLVFAYLWFSFYEAAAYLAVTPQTGELCAKYFEEMIP